MAAAGRAASLLVLALLTTGAGCTGSSQHAGDALPTARGIQGVAPEGLDALPWPDESGRVAALFAALPAELEGAGSLELTSERGGGRQGAMYYNPNEEFGESSQFAMVTATDSAFSDSEDESSSRVAAMGWAAMNIGGPGGCVGLSHSPVFAELCDPTVLDEPTPGAAPGFAAALERLDSVADPGGLLWMQVDGGPLDEDATMTQLHSIMWSDSGWLFMVTATTPELRVAAVGAAVSAAREA